jgi:AraC family transcriptional regulator of arabinose operon
MATQETDNETRVLVCNYSFHSRKVVVQERRVLKCYLIRLQTESTCRMLVNGKMVTVGPKDLLMFKPGDSYELRIGENKPFQSGDYFVICSGSWIDEWWKKKDRPQLQHLDNSDRLLPILKELVLRKRSVLENNDPLLDYLLRSLCLLIDQTCEESESVNKKTYVAIRMKRYIKENALQPLESGKVADYVKLSVSRAIHLFKEHYGKSMTQYVKEVRLDDAVGKMIYSNMTLEEISLSSGFSSYPYFYKVFTKHYGVSPSQYLKKYRD